jgi:hypothetical protein
MSGGALNKIAFMAHVQVQQPSALVPIINEMFDYCATVIDTSNNFHICIFANLKKKLEYGVGTYNGCSLRSLAILQCLHMYMIEVRNIY